jgi:hypothetical protein
MATFAQGSNSALLAARRAARPNPGLARQTTCLSTDFPQFNLMILQPKLDKWFRFVKIGCAVHVLTNSQAAMHVQFENL